MIPAPLVHDWERQRDSCREELLTGVEGIHFHTLCEQNADALELTLDAQ